MNRRNFIKITGLGIGTAALGSTVVGCSDVTPTDNFGWNGPDPAEQDIRMKVLAYAILCPNPHNKQPWIINLTGSHSFDLYVDPERLLPATDPFYRQIHIGQGTFLETLAIAASGLGHEASIDYFPQGMYSNTELLDKPVASIELIERPGITPDPLFAQLLIRHSNKREYDNRSLSQTETETLQSFHGKNNNHALSIVSSAEAKQHFEQILTDAMQIEVGDKGRDHETIAMFRFNEDEVKQHRDGFSVAQAGLSGLKKVFVENFILSRESTEKDPTSFGEQAVTMTQKAAESTATFAWITTTGNSRLDQVIVGREYCRINLKTTAMGLAQHPMSQVLQEYPEMLPLQARFKETFGIDKGDTVQMLFRLGRAEATPHGPRRLVTQIINS
ncbi:Acg family FMN-binding oxidoreductase [Amphritea japonica]|uniref:Uncharacterized protein n=1 Tax=Amphritea japonica ATCC BAA-1530 TaxID=1278309 RepID=A0A7R6P584_9GAMM|nr:hypothetical protein [Amphritea japonica]BBB27439.1 conserved hypothetical protein [Amphritea japonica ATCC BAA-1530]